MIIKLRNWSNVSTLLRVVFIPLQRSLQRKCFGINCSLITSSNFIHLHSGKRYILVRKNILILFSICNKQIPQCSSDSTLYCCVRETHSMCSSPYKLTPSQSSSEGCYEVDIGKYMKYKEFKTFYKGAIHQVHITPSMIKQRQLSFKYKEQQKENLLTGLQKKLVNKPRSNRVSIVR